MLILYYSFGASLVAIGSANARYFERKKIFVARSK
jgi:hypothetical protein